MYTTYITKYIIVSYEETAAILSDSVSSREAPRSKKRVKTSNITTEVGIVVSVAARALPFCLRVFTANSQYFVTHNLINV